MTSHHDVAGATSALRSERNLRRAWRLEVASLLESQAKALSEADSRYNTAVGSRLEWRHAAETQEARAIAAEARLAAFKTEATKVIDELVADLSGEIEGRYAGIKHYPSEARRYARDIATVVAARAFINAAKTQESKDA